VPAPDPDNDPEEDPLEAGDDGSELAPLEMDLPEDVDADATDEPAGDSASA